MHRILHSAIGVSALIVGHVATLALAQEADEQERLEELESEIRQSRERGSELAEKADAAATEIRALSVDLVARARAIRSEEEKVMAAEARLAEIDTEIEDREQLLHRQQQGVMNTLAALQRMSERPTEFYALRPADAHETVRTGLVLSEVIPALKVRAARLREELANLSMLKAERREEAEELTASLAELEAERERLDRMLIDRRQRRARLLADARTESNRQEDLAREAKDLRELLQRIERTQPREKPNVGDFAARPFSSARGELPMPVVGAVVERFGARTIAGRSRGIRISTRSGSQVLAPYDGRIVFSGPFRTYGQLLIIAHSEGYHSLLAGMAQIHADVGQWVLAGEPVGVMSAAAPAPDSEKPEDNGRTLYLEIRKGGEPVDPLPWLVKRRKVGG